jgi:hypothetical protein
VPRRVIGAVLEKSGELVAHDSVAVIWAANFEAVERASPTSVDALGASALLAPMRSVRALSRRSAKCSAT